MQSHQCFTCRNYEQGESKGPAVNFCRAFPAGIPFGIISGQVDHSQPVPGDHGIRRDPIPEDELPPNANARTDFPTEDVPSLDDVL